jgi:hypothetical protein
MEAGEGPGKDPSRWDVKSEVRDLCQAFADGLRDSLREKFHAVYVYGAVTFPETDYTGDVDFHVIVMEPPTETERAALIELHDRLAREFPPLGAELDGYYILLADARGSATPQHLLFPNLHDDSWALHRAHILAGRVIVLHGPDPKTIYVPPTRSEIEGALRGELDYVVAHLVQYPAYCVLNLCRLMYSHETGDVVTSKTASAVWASVRLPTWRPLIDAARRSYAHEATAEDRLSLSTGVEAFHEFAVGFIERARTAATGGGFRSDPV